MNEAQWIKIAYVSVTSVLAVCCILIAADMHGTGTWIWKRAPGILKRMPQAIHRTVMMSTLIVMGISMGLWAVVVATTPGYTPNWLQTAGHATAAMIGLGCVLFRPMDAALETTIHHG